MLSLGVVEGIAIEPRPPIGQRLAGAGPSVAMNVGDGPRRLFGGKGLRIGGYRGGASTCRFGWAAAISGTWNNESPIARTRG